MSSPLIHQNPKQRVIPEWTFRNLRHNCRLINKSEISVKLAAKMNGAYKKSLFCVKHLIIPGLIASSVLAQDPFEEWISAHRENVRLSYAMLTFWPHLIFDADFSHHAAPLISGLDGKTTASAHEEDHVKLCQNCPIRIWGVNWRAYEKRFYKNDRC